MATVRPAVVERAAAEPARHALASASTAQVQSTHAPPAAGQVNVLAIAQLRQDLLDALSTVAPAFDSTADSPALDIRRALELAIRVQTAQVSLTLDLGVLPLLVPESTVSPASSTNTPGEL